MEQHGHYIQCLRNYSHLFLITTTQLIIRQCCGASFTSRVSVWDSLHCIHISTRIGVFTQANIVLIHWVKQGSIFIWDEVVCTCYSNRLEPCDYENSCWLLKMKVKSVNLSEQPWQWVNGRFSPSRNWPSRLPVMSSRGWSDRTGDSSAYIRTVRCADGALY